MPILNKLDNFFSEKATAINNIFSYNSKGWEAWLQIELFTYLNSKGLNSTREEKVGFLKPDITIAPNNFIELKVQGAFLSTSDKIKELKRTVDDFINDCNKLSDYAGNGSKIALVVSNYSDFLKLLILKQYYNYHNSVLTSDPESLQREIDKISYNEHSQKFQYNRQNITIEDEAIVKKIYNLPNCNNVFYYMI